jgi:hypothetical protein
MAMSFVGRMKTANNPATLATRWLSVDSYTTENLSFVIQTNTLTASLDFSIQCDIE